MARVTVEDCLENVSNRFELVLIASKRARQLVKEGATPLVSPEGDKVTVIALREIALGFVDKGILEESLVLKKEEVVEDSQGEEEDISEEIIAETQQTDEGVSELVETAESEEAAELEKAAGLGEITDLKEMAVSEETAKLEEIIESAEQKENVDPVVEE